MGILFIADSQEIMEGKISDVYIQRTIDVLSALGIGKRVKVEVRARSFPENWNWGIFAGVEEVVEIVKNKAVKVESLGEGTVFHTNEPVLTIKGRYLDFAIFETSVLGYLCQP